MERKNADKFFELYPDQCKGLLDSLEADLLRLKIRGKVKRTEFKDMLRTVSMLRVRCMVFDFEGHIEMLHEMEDILEALKDGTSAPEKAVIDVLLDGHANLKKHFMGNASADEKELKMLIGNLSRIKQAKCCSMEMRTV